jgi:hypothetical protein
MVNMEITKTFRKQELEFEARYYLSEAKRLQRQGMSLIREADDMLEHAVLTWERAKEVAG